MTLSIVDSGFGNNASIRRMIEKIGGTARNISTPHEVFESTKIILPGVGHFDSGIRSLRTMGLLEPLIEKIQNDRVPVLGICLGMHLLCESSDEGDEVGLGLINAQVRRFNTNNKVRLKVPHMGWNTVDAVRDNAIIPFETKEENRYYFVHSYRVVPNNTDLTIGKSYYGGEFCAAFQQENIFGVQFHPEKSHRFGMLLFERFLSI